MKPPEGGIAVPVGWLWAALWTLWLATALALPLPPWRASSRLAEEERSALALAAHPAAAAGWSLDVGGTWQVRALGPGWSLPESYRDGTRTRRFAWIEGREARVAFASPGWDEAWLGLAAYPLEGLAPLAVDVELDGDGRGSFHVAGGWGVSTHLLGAVSAGPHVLALRPRQSRVPAGEARSLSLAVDALSVSPRPGAPSEGDRGVFAGTLRVGLDERPALFASSDAQPPLVPAGTERRQVTPDLTAHYAFGAGGAGGTAAGAASALHGLAAAALLTLFPGLAWIRGRGLSRLALALGLSAAFLVAALLSLRLLGRDPGPVSLALVLALSGVVGLRLVDPPPIAIAWPHAAAGAMTLALLVPFAGRVVPALEDQDMEVQATAHALATRQTPATVTNRGTAWFFAHPPLLHLWTAGSFVLAGRLDRVAYYHDEARAARGGPAAGRRGAPLSERPHHERWSGLLRRFLAEPQLWTTRQVNVLFSALSVALLARLAGGLAGPAAGLGLAAVLATFPEFLVRGSYGGYFAVTTLASLLVLGTLRESGRGGLATASVLAALGDQKGLVVPAGWLLAAPRGSGGRRILPLAAAAGGLAVFVVWGLAIDADAFLYDFVREHVARRLDPAHLLAGEAAASAYPSLPDLWREFAAHYGLLFTVWTGLACLAALKGASPEGRAAGAAALLGALVFSLTDWRQTKHLAQLVGPALVALAAAWPGPGPARRAAWAGLLLVLLHNVRTAWPLLASFESLRPRPGW